MIKVYNSLKEYLGLKIMEISDCETTYILLYVKNGWDIFHAEENTRLAIKKFFKKKFNREVEMTDTFWWIKKEDTLIYRNQKKYLQTE
jgi:hypothetical protein